MQEADVSDTILYKSKQGDSDKTGKGGGVYLGVKTEESDNVALSQF